MSENYLACQLLLLLIPISIMAQVGTLDPSFGGGDGYVITDFAGQYDQSYAVLQQSDGKIVSSGFSEFGEQQSLTRYLADGTLDVSFGTDGRVVNDFDNEVNFIYYSSILQQSDQKLVTSSTHRMAGGDQDFFMARYLTDGSLDASFGTNGTVMTNYGVDILSSSVLLPDGKILSNGWSTVGSSSYVLLTRHLTDGTLDTTFGVGGIVDTYINEEPTIVFPMAIQADGKIVIAFRKEASNNLKTLILHRYLSDGTLDTSFGTNGVLTTSHVSGGVYGSIDIKGNGKIVVAMRLGPTLVILTQYLPDGSLDLTFGTDGVTTIDLLLVVPVNVILDQDENIIVSGNNFGFEVGPYYITKYYTNGVLDTNFGTNGITELGFESASISLQSDGKILATGATYWYDGPVDFITLRFRNGTLGLPDKHTQDFNVYPNPSQDLFIINSGSVLDAVPYQLSDASGKVLQTGTLDGAETSIDLSGVVDGIYFVQVLNRTLKLIKN